MLIDCIAYVVAFTLCIIACFFMAPKNERQEIYAKIKELAGGKND